MNLRSKNEFFLNELNTRKKNNERMMKSQADMNQYNEKSQYRQKGKVGIGYTEEGESSKKGETKL